MAADDRETEGGRGVTRSWPRALDAGDRQLTDTQFRVRLSSLISEITSQRRRDTDLWSRSIGAAGRSDSPINARASVLGYRL